MTGTAIGSRLLGQAANVLGGEGKDFGGLLHAARFLQGLPVSLNLWYNYRGQVTINWTSSWGSGICCPIWLLGQPPVYLWRLIRDTPINSHLPI